MAYQKTIVFRRLKDGSTSVRRMCRRPEGGSYEVGDLIPTTNPTVLEAVVAQSLDDYEKPFDESEAIYFSDAEHTKFLKAHAAVSLTRLEDGTIELTPLMRVRGGYKGISDERIILSPHDSKIRMAEAIEDAFRVIV